MTAPQPRQPADIAALSHSLRQNTARIIAHCTAAFVQEGKDHAHPSPLEPLQKHLPLLLDELISLLPQVMSGAEEQPLMPAESMDCQAEHRLDSVIQTLTGIREVVVLELLQLKESVADTFLAEAQREVRLFFDLKIASYCRHFVAAQKPELELRNLQLKDAGQRLLAAPENSSAALLSRLHLLQGVTHELRNSLHSVLLFAESLLEGPRDPGVSEVMERLALNGIHLQKLLDRLQACSPFLGGELQPSLASVALGNFLADLEQRHVAIAKATKTRLLCTQTSGPATITTAVNMLNLIADNLVGNALNSAKFGLVQIEISAGDPGLILLKVADDGTGISPADARQMFRVIHHVHGSHSHGLKLGLLASRHLAHLLGGDITFQSEAGHGTSFVVSIPTNARQP